MALNCLRCNTLPSSASDLNIVIPQSPYPAYYPTTTATANRLRTNTLATHAHGLPSPHSPTYGPANAPVKPASRLLRLFAAGAVFETCTLSVPTYPAEGTTTTRATGAQTTRGGSAAKILAYVVELGRVAVECGAHNREHGANGAGGQGGWIGGLRRKKRDKDDRPGTASSGTGGGCGSGPTTPGGNASDALGEMVEAMLLASLGGAEEGVVLRAAVERVGVHTRFCKIWEGLGVPRAWVLHAADSDAHTIINHNPLPDLSHEDFIALLGPILAPENYPSFSPNAHAHAHPHSNTINLNHSPVLLGVGGPHYPTNGQAQGHGQGNNVGDWWSSANVPSPSPGSPAPFDWIHFEGRSVRTTLANMAGLDGLARERHLRHACAISLDLGPGRLGVESLIPHADIIFVTPLYPPLAAVLKPSVDRNAAPGDTKNHALSPRTLLLSLARSAPPHALLVAYCGRSRGAAALSVPTQEYFRSSELVKESPPQKADEDKAQKGKEKASADHAPSVSDDDADAFIAGMIFALSRCVVPGAPFCPSSSLAMPPPPPQHAPQPPSWLDDGPEKGLKQWNLSECLRFATEMAERAVRVRHSQGASEWGSGFGVGREMARAGWFE